MEELNTYYAFGYNIVTSLNFDESLPKSKHKYNKLLIFEKNLDLSAKQPSRIYRKGIRAKFKKTASGSLMSWNGIAKFESKKDSLCYEKLNEDLNTLKLFLLSEPIGCCLFESDYFLLHASAILIDGKAHIFTGEPGAGKSTTAAAFYKIGKTILSDDLVVIKIINEIPYVIPSLPQLKVWKKSLDGLNIDIKDLKPSFEGINKFIITQNINDFPQLPIPLVSITHLLSPNSRKVDKDFDILDAPTELLKHFPLPIQLLKKEKLANHFNTSLKIAQTSKISQIKRPLNFDLLLDFVINFN